MHRLPERLRGAAPRRQFGRDRRENVPAVEGGAGPADAEARELRGVEPDHLGVRMSAHDRRQQAIVGREENMSLRADTATMSREVPDPRVHHGDVHRAGRKILERARQPEAGFGRPVDHDLVREVDDLRLREAASGCAPS